MYQNDGLIQRFQAVTFADEQPYNHVDRPADTEAFNRVRDVVHQLANTAYSQWGAYSAEGEIPSFRLDRDAQVVFESWLIELETETLTAKEHPLILEHLSKFRSFVPALALINHLVEAADSGTRAAAQVSKDNVILAIAQAEYFESHARRMYGLVLGGLTASTKLAARILSGDLEDGFSVRDVYRNGWSQLGTGEAVEEACNVLIRKKWLKQERTTTSAQGGRPSVVYRINPRVYQWANISNN